MISLKQWDFWSTFCSGASILCCAFASLSYEAGDGTDEACVTGWNYPEPPNKPPADCSSLPPTPQAPAPSAQRPAAAGLAAAYNGNCTAKQEAYNECKEAVGFGGWAFTKRPCIFPYYMDDNDTPYDKCDLFGEPSFIVPVWRCPVFNIARKKNGINLFKSSDYENTAGLCPQKNNNGKGGGVMTSRFWNPGIVIRGGLGGI